MSDVETPEEGLPPSNQEQEADQFYEEEYKADSEPEVVKEKPEPVEVIDAEPVASSEPESNANLTSNQTTDKSADTYRVAIPSVTLEEFTKHISRFSEVFKDVTEGMQKWKTLSEEAVEFYTPGGLYQDRFFDKTSSFRQGVEDSNGKLYNTEPLKFKQGVGELKGEIALLKVSKMLGLGDVVNIMLPHSGVWVTIKPPTERDLIDFYNTVFREKILFGRATSGLTFSNFSVHMNHRLFDFMCRHIHSINYSDLPKDQLGNYMVIHDFPILAHGFARAMYPNGFDFQSGCVANIQECTHISKETLLLEKLIWVDNAALSVTQKNILSENRPNKLSLESYRTFIAEHSRVAGSSYTCKNGIVFKLKIPTFNEYTTDGLAWITGVSNTVESVMISTEDDDAGKEELLNQYVKASILRQFNHFIDTIEIDEEIVTDRETINNLLEVFSSDDEVRDELTRAVIEFKSKTTIGIIGIEEYTCPACGGNHTPNPLTVPRFAKVIPLDSVNLFFLMLTSKISRILERNI